MIKILIIWVGSGFFVLFFGLIQNWINLKGEQRKFFNQTLFWSLIKIFFIGLLVILEIGLLKDWFFE